MAVCIILNPTYSFFLPEQKRLICFSVFSTASIDCGQTKLPHNATTAARVRHAREDVAQQPEAHVQQQQFARSWWRQHALALASIPKGRPCHLTIVSSAHFLADLFTHSLFSLSIVAGWVQVPGRYFQPRLVVAGHHQSSSWQVYTASLFGGSTSLNAFPQTQVHLTGVHCACRSRGVWKAAASPAKLGGLSELLSTWQPC